MTRPLAGTFRRAVTQSVGAGCCSGGTLSIQIRHIPEGGANPGGSGIFRFDTVGCGLTGVGRPCASAAVATPKSAARQKSATGEIRLKNWRIMPVVIAQEGPSGYVSLTIDIQRLRRSYQVPSGLKMSYSGDAGLYI